MSHNDLIDEKPHTPGPWKWDDTVWDYDPEQQAPWLVTEDDKAQILTGEIKCPSEANARLIAAAPELLAELKKIVAGLESYFEGRPAHSLDRARAVIAKAEGR